MQTNNLQQRTYSYILELKFVCNRVKQFLIATYTTHLADPITSVKRETWNEGQMAQLAAGCIWRKKPILMIFSE